MPGAPVVLPRGFSSFTSDEGTGDAYRSAAKRRVCIEQRWNRQFGRVGTMMLVWGTGMTAVVVGAVGHWQASGLDAGVLVAIPLSTMGLVGLFVGLANLINVTRVTIEPSTIRREIGPLPWPGWRHVWQRTPEPNVGVRAVRKNTLRNGGGGTNPPLRHEVVSMSGKYTDVLFDQIASRADAELVLAAVREALAGGRR